MPPVCPSIPGHGRPSARALARRAAVLLAVAAAACSAFAAQPASSATSGTVVGATVPSATSVDPLGCRADTSGMTSLGAVPAGSFVKTGTDCVVGFGSSNAAARLLVFQGDGSGDALAKATAGAYDADFDGGAGGNGSVPLAGATVTGPGVGVQGAVDPRTGAIYVLRSVTGGDITRVERRTTTGDADLAWDGPSTIGNGTVDLDLYTGGLTDLPQGIAVQADGKVLIAHHGGKGFRVTRLNTDGTYDTAFGTGGTAIAYDPGVNDGAVTAVTLDALGRIYLAGWRNSPSADALVVRLSVDGLVDSSFGVGGQATSASVPGFVATSAVVQPDGMVLIGGVDGSGRFSFARFDVDGVLDPAFIGPAGSGSGDFTVVNGPGGYQMFDLGLTGDGRIRAVGTFGTGLYTVGLLGADGALDLDYDGPYLPNNGIWSHNPASGTAVHAALVDADGYITMGGDIVVTGTVRTYLARFDREGRLDATFVGPAPAVPGYTTIDVAAGATETVWDLVRGTDGDLVSIGTEGATSTGRLLRFDTTTIPDYANGVTDWSTGANGAFGMCLSSLTGTGAAIAPAWTPDARCATPLDSTNGTWWDDVPDNALDADAQVASLASLATNGIARFRFGFRPGSSTAPGRYLAPVTFQVLSP